MPPPSLDKVRRKLFQSSNDGRPAQETDWNGSNKQESPTTPSIQSSTASTSQKDSCHVEIVDDCCTSGNEGSSNMASCTEKESTDILLITDFHDSSTVSNLIDKLLQVEENAHVLHCLPEKALAQCDAVGYKIIFTDIHLLTSSEILRTVYAIRKTSQKNKWTPIVAVHQDADQQLYVPNLTTFGINQVQYGPLSYESMKEIFDSLFRTELCTDRSSESYKDSESIYSERIDTEASRDVTRTETQRKIDCAKARNSSREQEKEHDPANSVTCSAPTAVSYTKPLVTEPSSNTHQFGKDSKHPSKSPSFLNGRQPVRPRVISKDTITVSPCYSRLLQSLPVRGTSISTTWHTSTNTVPRGFSYYPALNPAVSLPGNLPYMVTGAPGSASMKITVLPEDDTRHSTKERYRRERIKTCCEQLRQMLPKSPDITRRLDMATVLELAVLYIRIFQSHMPSVLQEQTDQIFHYFHNQTAEKRKHPGEVPFSTDPQDNRQPKCFKRYDGIQCWSTQSRRNIYNSTMTAEPTLALSSTPASQYGPTVTTVCPSVVFSSYPQSVGGNQAPFAHMNGYTIQYPQAGHHLGPINEASAAFSPSATSYETSSPLFQQHIEQAAAQKSMLFNNLPLSSLPNIVQLHSQQQLQKADQHYEVFPVVSR